MKKYKDNDNRVYEIENGFEYLLPTGCTEITDTEADVLLLPSATQQAAIDKEILRGNIEALTVTTQAGNKFDADEESQNAILRVLASEKLSENWKLADDSWTVITSTEFKEALKLAVEAVTALKVAADNGLIIKNTND